MHEVLVYRLVKCVQEKVWLGELTDSTKLDIAVDWDAKYQTNKRVAVWLFQHLSYSIVLYRSPDKSA